MVKNRTFSKKILTILLSIQFFLMIGGMNYAAASEAPLSTFEDEVVQADANIVYFIFPDHDERHVKPPGVNYAWLSDWTAIGFLYSMCSNMPQKTTPDTRTSLFNSTDGEPNSVDACFVLFGGPLVNAPVHYYETNRLAPVYHQNDGNSSFWYRNDGTRIDETEMPFSDMETGRKDMFVVEAFIDDSGNKVFIIYGYGWKGTFAGGRFFKFVIYPNISSYSDSFYIYKWVDDNDDGFVDLDEIYSTPTASG